MRLTILSLFITLFFFSTDAQRISEAIAYKYNESDNSYSPDLKYVYDHDADHLYRLTAYEQFKFESEESPWIPSRCVSRTYDENNRLQSSNWMYYKEGELARHNKKTYTLDLDARNEVFSIEEEDINVLTGDIKINVIDDARIVHLMEYNPLYIKFAPQYVLDHGHDLQFDTDGNLIYAMVESCRLMEYHYTYNNTNLAQYVEVSRIDEEGQMKKFQKVFFTYEDFKVPQPEQTISIEAYPNPTKNYVRVSLDKGFEQAKTVHLTDIYGNVVGTYPLDAYQIETQLSLSDLSAGVYLLSLGKGYGTAQVVKVD